MSAGTFDVTDTTDENSVASLVVNGGEQSGDLTVTSTLSWTGGTLGGTGTTTVASGATAYASLRVGERFGDWWS